MKINNMVKFIFMIIVLESIITIATSAPRINLNEQCFWHCTELCLGNPVCLVQCLSNCIKTQAVADDVRMCAATCVQSTCFKFIGSGN